VSAGNQLSSGRNGTVSKHDCDARTYEELCLSLAPRMKALVARLTGSASMAEDVFQEAVLRVWKQLPGLRDGSNLSAYFARVVTNLSMDTHRVRRRDAKALAALSAEQAPAPTQHSAGSFIEELTPALMQAVRALPSQQREALVLRYFEELSYPELAELLSCSEATARSHVSKAKAALKQRLEHLPTFRRFHRLEDRK